MYEVLLGPQHGLKQSQDYTLTLRYKPEYGIVTGDSARMQVRYTLDDAEVLDELTTANGRITIVGVTGSQATVILEWPGETTRDYPILDADSAVRYRKLKADEISALPEAMRSKGAEFQVLEMVGTLLITDSTQQDRPGPLDFKLLMEASVTRRLTP